MQSSCFPFRQVTFFLVYPVAKSVEKAPFPMAIWATVIVIIVFMRIVNIVLVYVVVGVNYTGKDISLWRFMGVDIMSTLLTRSIQISSSITRIELSWRRNRMIAAIFVHKLQNIVT